MKTVNIINKALKLYNTRINFIDIYYFISILLFFFKDDFFFRNLILSFQFIFISIGISLFFSSCINIEILIKKFNIIEKTFLLFFFGHVFIILLYIFLDSIDILKSLFVYIYPTLFLISYLGFYYVRKQINETKLLLLENRIFQKDIYFVIFASFILILVCYFINFSIFWDYPLINLYQEIHFLNAAQNLAHNKSIDNFNTASSFPLVQIFFGNLIFFYDLDPIDFYINFKISNYFINILVIYLFFKNFIKDNAIIFFLILLFSITSHLLLSSNPGDSVGIYSLFLITFFIKNSDYKNLGSGFFSKSIFLFFIFIFMIASRYLKIDFSYYFIIFLIAFIILTFFKGKIFNISTYLFFFLITLFLTSYHRSSFLFLFCSILVIFFHLVFFNKNILNDLHKKLFFYLGLAFGIYVFIDLSFQIFYNKNSINFLNILPTFVFELLANKKILNTFDSGAGFKGAIIEFVRRLGEPACLFLMFFSLVGFFKFFYEYQKNNIDNFDPSFINNNLILIISISFLLFLSFNEIPYTHRAQFILILLIFAFCGVQFAKYKQLIFNNYAKLILIIFPGVFFLYYTHVNASIFFESFVKNNFTVNFNSNSSYKIYSESLKNYKLILLSIWYFNFVFIFFSWFKKYKFQIFFSSIFIIFLYSQFFSMPLKYFSAYPYKGSPEHITLSHYKLKEIYLAKEINKRIVDQKIYFSDPTTLGIFLSYSNSYPLYPFINLRLEHISVELSFNEVTKYLKICSINGNCDRDIFIEKLNKFRNVELSENIQVTIFFKSKNKKLRNEDLFFIINSRFLNFKNTDEDYFPNYDKLSLNQIRNLKKIFTVIINRDDEILICKLK